MEEAVVPAAVTVQVLEVLEAILLATAPAEQGAVVQQARQVVLQEVALEGAVLEAAFVVHRAIAERRHHRIQDEEV